MVVYQANFKLRWKAIRDFSTSMIKDFISPAERNADSLQEPRRLRNTALQHGVVRVSGWAGSEAEFVELGRSFGLLERTSRNEGQHRGELFRVTSIDNSAPPIGSYWHADGFAHSKSPPLLTIYHVATGASHTSRTSFIDGHLAWNRIDYRLKNLLHNLTWTHSCGTQHPFVRRHVRLCGEVLSINLGKMVAINGMNEMECQAMVTGLSRELDLIPCYAHQWRNGDILIVDNRRMLHHAPKMIIGERILWRVSVVA